MSDRPNSDLGVLVSTVWRIPHVGGLSTHMELLVEALQREGALLGSLKGNDFYGSIFEKGIRKLAYRLVDPARPSRVRQMDLWSKYLHLKSAMKSRMRAAGGRKLVINTQDPIATCAAIDAGIPSCAIVETVHGPWSKEQCSEYGLKESHYFVRAALRYEMKAFHSPIFYITVDNGQADIIANEFGVSRDRIRIISNAVDVQKLAEWTPAPLRHPLPKKYFVVPRRLVPKNGVEFAIRGFAQAALPDMDLAVAGEGPLMSAMQALVAELGIADKVHFLGGIPPAEMYSLLKNATGVIVPSVPSAGVIEATSLSVLEAMAIGTPVIGSAVGGIAEIMAGGNVGYLVPPADVTAFGSAIRAIAALDASGRTTVIRNARERVQTKFGVDRWLGNIISVYNEAHDAVNHARPATQRSASSAKMSSYSGTTAGTADIHAEVKGN